MQTKINRRTALALASGAAATAAVPATAATADDAGAEELRALVAAVDEKRAAYDAFSPIHTTADQRLVDTHAGRDNYSEAEYEVIEAEYVKHLNALTDAELDVLAHPCRSPEEWQIKADWMRRNYSGTWRGNFLQDEADTLFESIVGPEA